MYSTMIFPDRDWKMLPPPVPTDAISIKLLGAAGIFCGVSRIDEMARLEVPALVVPMLVPELLSTESP